MSEIENQIFARIQSFPMDQAKVLSNLREEIKKLAPGASERISYAMPTFEVSGQILIHFDGFENHNSLFPGPEVIERLKSELGAMAKSKGTIQFPKNQTFPKSLLRQILQTRIEIINESFPKKNGEYLSFYDNGHLKSKGKYLDGQMHGHWEFYRRDGSRMRTGKLLAGKPVGAWQTHVRTASN